MAKKKKNREKLQQNPPKKKYTAEHDRLYAKEIAPRIREKDTALAQKNYLEAERLRAEIAELRKEWKVLKYRRNYFKV